MYELYIVQCKDQIPEKDIVRQAVYRKIFNEEYNFSFHVPKRTTVQFAQPITSETLKGHLQMI